MKWGAGTIQKKMAALRVFFLLMNAVAMAQDNTKAVTDRFHVVKLVIDALQHIRIRYRWEELDKENKTIEKAKISKKKYRPEVFSNGDPPKQLLARSGFLLFKESSE